MTEKLSLWDIETNVVKREVENENEIPNEQKMNLNFFCPLCTLAVFDLTTHCSNLVGGRRRRYH
jgi:hypothetical protein